ncbi:hypothetical protein OHT52_21260 [Streptomyces sp. NBC_00247]|uniref:hypothetical protein n=1 Tax=Streptomyces sp. NBC_00247 TaxID=2975689 RepID=UPI002E286EFE|nr:hypothetical protein [Streptomyces sp. NBC_00247]
MTYPRTERSRIPAAVAAVVAAVIEENPSASPDTIGRLAVIELARDGWHWHLGHRLRCAPARTADSSNPNNRTVN